MIAISRSHFERKWISMLKIALAILFVKLFSVTAVPLLTGLALASFPNYPSLSNLDLDH
jgi:hypothetical protein